MSSKEAQTEGRLRARPVQVTGSAPVGLQPLMLGAARDSYLYVAASYRADRPVPLVLLLHGAGGHARQGLELLLSLADAAGLLLLAPASRDRTWDLLVDCRYSPDAAMIDRALEQTFPATPSIRCVWPSGVSRMGPPTRSLWGSPTGTSSRTCSRSCGGSRPRPGGLATAQICLPRRARRGASDRPLQSQ